MTYMNQMLEFQKIINQLKDFTVTDKASQKFDGMVPLLNEAELMSRLLDTTAARQLLDMQGNPPLAAVSGIREITENAQLGLLLSAEDFEQVRQFAVLCMRMERYLNKNEELDNRIAAYGRGFQDLDLLKEEIERCIRSGRVDDSASPQLRDIRRKISSQETAVRAKLDSILRTRRECFSESFVSNRNGHYTLPVKKEYKSQVQGTVIDTSSSGGTFFIEPSSVGKLRAELNELEIAESNEERKILYQLMGNVADFREEIFLNLDYIEELDYVFAKAKLSYDLKAVCPSFHRDRGIHIVEGRHPLIRAEECVPLTISFGQSKRGVVITGPNTGGKTVALKTVGLLSVMAQCGLHIPCQSAQLCMNSQVLCDIGDGQSISQNLSTFSAHIKNVINILNQVDAESLVLMDELGSGTDPSEGEGIAIAVLEELQAKQCNFIVTTHYPAVKSCAEKYEYVINARMAFDKESLQPLYRLEMGESGESCALAIAKRLGLPEKLLKRAYEAAYTKKESKEAPGLYGLLGAEAEAKNENKPNVSKIVRKQQPKPTGSASDKFEVGDSVLVYPQKDLGIIFQKADGNGEVGVQIRKKKVFVKYKRLKLQVSANELYPPDYDFSIVFDTVENRKARHLMEKRHVEGNEVHYPEARPASGKK